MKSSREVYAKKKSKCSGNEICLPKSSKLRRKCDKCSITFSRNKELLKHKLLCHDPDGYKLTCKVCSLSFATPIELRNHKKKEHLLKPSRTNICVKCGQRFIDKNSRDIHFEKCVEFICVENECEFKTTTNGRMRLHRKKSGHLTPYQRFMRDYENAIDLINRDNKSIETDYTSPEPIAVEVCPLKGSDTDGTAVITNKHIASKKECLSESDTIQTIYPCHLCDFISTEPVAVCNHLQEVHSISYKLVDPRGMSAMKLACFLCGKRYHSYQILKLHITCDHQTNAVQNNPKDDSPAISSKPEENLPFLTTETEIERKLALLEN